MVLLRCLFDCARITIRISGQVSREAFIGMGLLWGPFLSPVFLNIFIDLIPRTLRGEHQSFLLNSREIISFLYADDIVLMLKNQEGLQNIIDTCERHSISYGHVFASHKCEIIVLQGKEAPCITIHREKVRQIPSFECLESPFNGKGVDVAGLWVKGISVAVEVANLFSTVGCKGTGVSLTVSRWILITFVRLQMETG